LLTGVVDTGENVTGVFVTCHSLFTGVIDTGDKFIAGFVVTSDNCSAVSTTPVINLSPVSTTPLIRDTGDKFVYSILFYSFAIISANFRKSQNDPNKILRGPGDTDL
jgi:hypothetical protein